MKIAAQQDAVARQLVVHHRHGVERIQLSGDEKLDALLRRFAAKGGAFVIDGTVHEEIDG